jgi:hypothetical protein
MSCEVMMALSELDHLLHLSYDVPIPYGTIANNPRYGTFGYHSLSPFKSRWKLRSIDVKFRTTDDDKTAFFILLPVIRSCSKTLQSLNLSFYAVVTGIKIGGILKLHFPSLLQFSVHPISVEWRFLKAFLDRHESHLQQFDCLLYSTYRHGEFYPGLSDPVLVGDLPGLQGVKPTFYEDRRLVRQPFSSYILHLCRDASGQISCNEAAVTGGAWEAIPLVGQGYPHLRILNIWDAKWSHRSPHFEVCSLLIFFDASSNC